MVSLLLFSNWNRLFISNATDFVLANSNPSSPPQSPAKLSSSAAPVVNNISYTNTMTNGSTNGNGRKFAAINSFFFEHANVFSSFCNFMRFISHPFFIYFRLMKIILSLTNLSNIFLSLSFVNVHWKNYQKLINRSIDRLLR